MPEITIVALLLLALLAYWVIDQLLWAARVLGIELIPSPRSLLRRFGAWCSSLLGGK